MPQPSISAYEAGVCAPRPEAVSKLVDALRNYLARDYDGADYGIMWGLIADDLPTIAQELLNDVRRD